MTHTYDIVGRVIGDTMPAGPPVRAVVLIGVVVALACSLALAWAVVLPSPIARDLVLASRGLLQPTLITSAVTWLLVGSVLALSGVPLRELGLRRRDVPRALAVLIAVYGALQLAIVVAALVCTGRIALADRDAATAVGGFGAQLFGNAPVEEAVFRGFLLRQLLARARLRGGVGPLVAATAAAAVIFALWHIPLRIHEGYRGLDLIASLVVAALGGVLVSYLYLRSGNLLIIVVLHALFNNQAPLFASPVPPQWILCVLTIGVIIWIELAARRSPVGHTTRADSLPRAG